MNLEAVLANIPLRGTLPPHLRSLEIGGLEYDSRRVHGNVIYFAFSGAKADGRQFAAEALQRGAVAIASELPPLPGFSGPWLELEHGRRALSLACRNFYGPPERTLSLNAVTGTNGKTTITYLMDAVFRKAGHTTAILGTIGNWVAGTFQPAVNTTPESLDLYRLLEQLRQHNGTHVSMEVSSHALALARVYALSFHTVLFTNLTQDHLDFHHSMEAYFDAKKMLFFANGAAAPQCAVINIDDPYGRQISPGPDTRLLTYGLSPEACIYADQIQTGFDGLAFDLHFAGKSVPVRSSLAGEINVYNILAACGLGISHGLELSMIAEAIEEVKAVPGRFERIDEGQPFSVIVDYAHTPDALRNAIRAARTLKPKRVITLFGCGGDRDRTKRPLMGMAAAELSDYVVLTSDNPRSEDPLDIINDTLVGLRRLDTPHTIEADRYKGIRMAIEQARSGDLILIAGKGHEDYQVLRDKLIHFDDREAARQLLQEFGYSRKNG